MKIIDNLPFPDYLKEKEFLSNHQLGYLDECPAAFQYYLHAESEPSSTDQIEGSCFDLIMEDMDLFLDLVTRDEKRKTVGYEDLSNGYTLGWERYDRVLTMAKNVREHPDCKVLLRKGKFQASVFTELEDVKVKSRPDFLPDNIPIILDFKTTRVKPTERNIAYEVAKWKYYRQASFYLDQQLDKKTFVFLFASKVPPYLPAIYEPDAETLEHGRREYRRLLELYKRCVETGEWPGHHGIRPLSLPKCILTEGE
jgi:hypothetical protein